MEGLWYGGFSLLDPSLHLGTDNDLIGLWMASVFECNIFPYSVVQLWLNKPWSDIDM